MSSAVRINQMPYFSFHRSSTPVPYSFGNPTLNCWGGSFKTFGNMKRPVAARAAAVAAENAPHASPIQARRVKSGDVSSGSLVAAAAVAGLLAAGVAALAAAPPAEATVVVLPARLAAGGAGGRGAGAGRACAVAVAGAAGAPLGTALAGRAGATAVPTSLSPRDAPSGLVSSAMTPHCCQGKRRFLHADRLTQSHATPRAQPA